MALQRMRSMALPAHNNKGRLVTNRAIMVFKTNVREQTWANLDGSNGHCHIRRPSKSLMKFPNHIRPCDCSTRFRSAGRGGLLHVLGTAGGEQIVLLSSQSEPYVPWYLPAHGCAPNHAKHMACIHGRVLNGSVSDVQFEDCAQAEPHASDKRGALLAPSLIPSAVSHSSR